jgi:flavin-dependent dehydrogenase
MLALAVIVAAVLSISTNAEAIRRSFQGNASHRRQTVTHPVRNRTQRPQRPGNVEHYHVATLGAGPGGSHAALKVSRRLQKANAKANPKNPEKPRVLLLEKRGRQATRPQYVLLSPKTVKSLKKEGVLPHEPPPRLNLPDHITEGHRRTGSNESVDYSPKFPMAPIHEIENGLRRKVDENEHITAHYNATVDPNSVKQKGGKWHFSYSDHEGNVRHASANVLIDATGAKNTPLKKKLGTETAVSQHYRDKKETVVTGILAKPPGKLARQGPGMQVLEGKKGVGIHVKVPEGQTFHDDAAMTSWWRRRVNQGTGIPENTPLRAGLSRFNVELRKAGRVTNKDSVFAVGDAARTVHYGTGEGLNTAIADGKRVARTVVDMRKGKLGAVTRFLAARRYRKETEAVTKEVHNKSADQFR